MNYVIGDVHGCFDELMALINKIESLDDDARFILVGDLIDRGPKTLETIVWAKEHITDDGKYQCIRGNHEQLVINWFREEFLPWKAKPSFLKRKTVPPTKFDFSDLLTEMDMLEIDEIEPMIDFFDSLPYSKERVVKNSRGEDIRFIIAHAWYDVREKDELVQREINLWMREVDENLYSDDIIIHGHTPTIVVEGGETPDTRVAPGMIAYAKNAINVDGGCVFGSRYGFPHACMLAGLCLETLEEFYPWTLEERFAMIGKSPVAVSIAESYADSYRNDYLKEMNRYRKEMLERLK